MKPHEHALISLSYATAISVASGQGLGRWEIYLAALIGGEIIDIIDHPLYHLVYNRNEPHVVEAREKLQEEGLRSAIDYLNEVEEKREFKGLLLHNIYALSLLSAFSIIAAFFVPGPAYLFVGIGAFLLHMFADLWGDFKRLGHIDNWLWVLSESTIDSFGRMGRKVVTLVLAWVALIQTGFVLLTIRSGWQLANLSSSGLAYESSLYNIRLLAYLPLGILTLYHLNVAGVWVAYVHKYRLEIGNPKNGVPFSLGSVRLLGNLISGKIQRNQQNFEKVYLRMQADQAVWAVLLAILIAVVLTVLSLFLGPSSGWTNEQRVFFVLIPVLLALLFGTLIHTTIGEFGGVWGVLLAISANLLLGRLGVQETWEADLGYWLFGAAVGAWVLGLLGGIVLKGQSRMSLVVFSIRFEPTDKKDELWLQDVLTLTRKALATGYANVHEIIHGPADGIDFVSMPSANLMLTPYRGRPLLGEEWHHLQASDSYSAILRSFNYVFCDNRLTSTSQNVGKYGLLPILPRQRKVGNDIDESEMYWDGYAYHWRSEKRPIELRSTYSTPPNQENPSRWLLFKSWSEFLDHLVTRAETVKTDVFVFPEKDTDAIVVSGITRECTSTKAYATVEAEAYAGSVVGQINELSDDNPRLRVAEQATARLFYPRISFFDLDLIDWVERLAVIPTASGGFSRQDLIFIQKSLEQLPDEKLIPNATADLRKKAGVLGIQYAITLLVGYLNIKKGWLAHLLGFIKGQF
jgi:hypothetical protein